MGEIIYDKLVYGRELTPEQWSKLKYRPLDDKDMYGIAENPSFGIDKSLIGGGNYVEMFYHNEDLGDINILCALFNIEAEHEEHQYLVEDEHPEQVYDNTDEVQIPYLFVGPNYTGQDTPTATLGVNDWNDLISGRNVQFGYTKTGEEEPKPAIHDGSKTYDINFADYGEYYEFYIDTDNTELINALNTNGLYINGADFTLDNLSVTRPKSFDTADFTKISFSKTAPLIYESVLPENYYLYIKEPFSIDNGENDYVFYGDIGEDYLESSSNEFCKFYVSPQTYSTPNVEVYPDSVGIGTVSVSPQKSSYEALSEITMTATPNEGYMFGYWIYGDGNIEENPHTDRVGPNYYAFFGRPVTITVEAEPIEGGTVSGGGTYAEGSEITISATPNEGYEFLGWWEGEDQRTGSDAAEWNIKVGSEDTTYTAKFSSLEDRRLIYTTNSDAGEIQWIAQNCEEGTYTHDENGGTAILRNNVETIGGFTDNNKLTGIVIPESIKYISDEGFQSCTNLASITLPESLETISGFAFSDCSSLTSIYIPENVYQIGNENEAFNGCSGLTSIVVSENNETYDSRGNCNAIIETDSDHLIRGCVNTTIPNDIVSIGKYAFNGCDIQSITIPNSVTSLGESAFEDCTNLSSITLSENITDIPDDTFNGCSSLTSINLPDGLIAIGYAAFNSTGLTSIIIPSTVEEIGEYAFNGCEYLNSITCNAVEPPQLGGEDVFVEVPATDCTVPIGSESSYLDSAWTGHFNTFNNIGS